MVAPLPETGEEATCSLWFMAMDPADPAANVGEKVELPGRPRCTAASEPFELRIGDAVLSDTRHDGRARAGRAPLRVGPALAARACRPTATCTRSLRARQASRRPSCSCRTRTSRSPAPIDLGRPAHRRSPARAAARRTCGAPSTPRAGPGRTATTSRRRRRRGRGTFVDGVSVFVPRFGRELGPNTPVVARVGRRGPALDQPAGGAAQPERVRPRRAGASRRATRRRKLDGRGDGARPRTSSASPTTTPTASSPTATTPRSPTCALEVFERAGPSRELAQGRTSCAPTAARTSSTRSASRSRALSWRSREPDRDAPGVSAPFAWTAAASVSWLEAAARRRAGRLQHPARRRQRGPYDSLNLGILTDDDPDRVRRNRELLAQALGREPASIAMGRQVHGADVQVHGAGPRSRAGELAARSDAQVTTAPELTPLVLVADCVPLVARGARRGGGRPLRLAGRGGGHRRSARVDSAARAAGAAPVARGARARRSGRAATRSGTRSSTAFRARGHASASPGGRSTCRLRSRRSSSAPACDAERSPLRALHELQPGAVLLAPPRRRRHRPPGRARLARARRARSTPERVRAQPRSGARARSQRACARAGRDPRGGRAPGRDQVRAARADGRAGRGRHRAGGREHRPGLVAKQERWGDRFTCDFIGHLQSRKTKQVLPRVRLIHSVESESVLRQIERHASGRRACCSR